MDKLVFECVKYSLRQTDNVIKGYNLEKKFINEYVYNDALDNDEKPSKDDFKDLSKELIKHNKSKSFINKVAKGLGKKAKNIFFRFIRLGAIIIIAGQVYLTVIGVADLNRKQPVFKSLGLELELALENKDIEKTKALIKKIEEEINSGPEETREVLVSLIKKIKARRHTTKFFQEGFLKGLDLEFVSITAATKIAHSALLSLSGKPNIYYKVHEAEKELESIDIEENNSLEESIASYTREKLKTILLWILLF